MKRTISVVSAAIAAGALAFALAGCGCTVNINNTGSDSSSDSTSTSEGMENPVTESDEQGVVEATGIDLPVPAGVEDAAWSYIDDGSDNLIAQVTFTYNGKTCTMRAQSTGDIEAYDISGMYYTWTAEAAGDVGNCDAAAFTCSECGYVQWLDVVPGIDYCFAVEEPGITTEELFTMATECFVPMQGEA